MISAAGRRRRCEEELARSPCDASDFCEQEFCRRCHTGRFWIVLVSEPIRRRTMTAELDPFAAAPELMKHWVRTSLAIASSLDPKLVGLVEIRASQINGCANCLNMHAA